MVGYSRFNSEVILQIYISYIPESDFLENYNRVWGGIKNNLTSQNEHNKENHLKRKEIRCKILGLKLEMI